VTPRSILTRFLTISFAFGLSAGVIACDDKKGDTKTDVKKEEPKKEDPKVEAKAETGDRGGGGSRRG
jgi:hypothetical protein